MTFFKLFDMSESTQEGNDNANDNIKASDLTTTDETLIQTNLGAEATEPQSNPTESLLHQDEIKMTLREFNQKLKDNDRSIKRIEESMVTLYKKLDKTPQVEESKISTMKLKKKKQKKLDKKGKKQKKLDKKGKKKSKKIKSGKKTKSAKAITNAEKKKTSRTNLNGKKGRMKNAGKKK